MDMGMSVIEEVRDVFDVIECVIELMRVVDVFGLAIVWDTLGGMGMSVVNEVDALIVCHGSEDGQKALRVGSAIVKAASSYVQNVMLKDESLPDVQCINTTIIHLTAYCASSIQWTNQSTLQILDTTYDPTSKFFFI